MEGAIDCWIILIPREDMVVQSWLAVFVLSVEKGNENERS